MASCFVSDVGNSRYAKKGPQNSTADSEVKEVNEGQPEAWELGVPTDCPARHHCKGRQSCLVWDSSAVHCCLALTLRNVQDPTTSASCTLPPGPPGAISLSHEIRSGSVTPDSLKCNTSPHSAVQLSGTFPEVTHQVRSTST